MSEIVIVCSGGCGRTTEGLTDKIGRFEPSLDLSCIVPVWTCPDCLDKCEIELKGATITG